MDARFTPAPIRVDDYLGREDLSEDTIDAERMALLAAMLDRDWAGHTRLPPLAHFLLFRPHHRQSMLGSDGHPVRGANGMMPAVDLPRRMWAGSRIVFHRDLSVGEPVTRRSRLVAAEQKSGRSGTMLFCTVEHTITGRDTTSPAIVEQQDIVYREAHRGSAPAPRPVIAPAWEPTRYDVMRADPVMLFRYSALTFNSHRIHYDRDYAAVTEGYGGLVVQGPLLATLLLDHLERASPGRIVREFAFRALSPVFDQEEFQIGSRNDGSAAQLAIVSPVGVGMSGTAMFAS